MIQVNELHQKVAKDSESPIIVFNGELDRIRSGYYPSLLYPRLGKLAKNFLPQFESAYYIHNFKGSVPGTHAKSAISSMVCLYVKCTFSVCLCCLSHCTPIFMAQIMVR